MSVEWDEDGVAMVEHTWVEIRAVGDSVGLMLPQASANYELFTPSGARAIAARLLALADEIDPQ